MMTQHGAWPSDSTLPTVAIVGRINVGKSTLFNAILGYERSVSDPTPGVTRDRLRETVRHRGVAFSIEDTGGLEPGRSDHLQSRVNDQARSAVEQADYVILVVDLEAGCQPLDEENARIILKHGKPFCVAVNKMDLRPRETTEPAALSEFHKLAGEIILPIAAAHRRGVGDLLDHVTSRLRQVQRVKRMDAAMKDILAGPASDHDRLGGADEMEHAQTALAATNETHGGLTPSAPPVPGLAGSRSTAVAIVGRPNAGKSTLLNTLLGRPLMLTDSRPGTTRDAVDAELELGPRRYIFTDSAGIRRRARVDTRLEEKTIGQALRSIDRADVALLVMDVKEPGAVQDVRLAQHALRRGKGLVLVLTQCDLVEDADAGKAEWAVRGRFPHLNFCPILKISGLTGEGTERILPLVDRLDEQLSRQIPDDVVQHSLKKALEAYQPPRVGGHGFSIRSARQSGSRPPAFTLTVQPFRRVPEHYQTFLLHHFQRDFHLHEVPIRLHFRPWIGLHPKRSVASRRPPHSR